VLGGGNFDPRPYPPQRLATGIELQRQHFGLHRVVSLRGIRLPAQRAEALLRLVEDVDEPLYVLGRLLETPHRAVPPGTVLGDACRLFDDGSLLVGPGVEYLPDLALPHQDVLVAANAAIAQQLLEIEEPALRAVQLVLGCAVPEEPPRQGDLGQVEGQEPVAVVERDGDLGPGDLRSGGSPGEDHVVHTLRTQLACRLGAHRPRQGVEDVGLAGAIGADDDVDPGVEFEAGPVGERLEAGK
jgi:hypothetical protein